MKLIMLTWWYFANGSRMPAVTLIAVRALHKDARVGQTLCEHFAADIIQSDAFTDMSPSLLHYCITIHIREQTEAKTLRIARIGETIHCYTRLRCMKRFTHSRV